MAAFIEQTSRTTTLSAHPDDTPFQHYTWKHRIVAWVSQRLFDWPVYTVPTGILKGLRRKGGLTWITKFTGRETLSKEDKFLAKLADEGVFQNTVVYDVGAFQGLKTLFFVRSGASVVAFEPLSKNRRRLEQNLALNNMRASVRPVGLSDKIGHAILTVSALMPGGGSMDPTIIEGIREWGKTRSETIPITTLDTDQALEGYPEPTFIKIDVEGLELSVLRGAEKILKDYKPALFLEMHGETIRDKKSKIAAIVTFLLERGYHIIHVESKDVVTLEDLGTGEGHLYCTRV